MSFRFDSDVIMHGLPQAFDDWNVVQIFGYFLHTLIGAFARWYDRHCNTADPSEQWSGGVKRSLLLVMIISALRRLSLYDQFLGEAEVDYGSFWASWLAFLSWTDESARGRRRWRWVKDDFWRQLDRILCQDDDNEFDTDSEHEKPGEDGRWESASDMD